MHIWVSIGIGIASMLFAAGVAWGVVSYKVRHLEKGQTKLEENDTLFRSMIEALQKTIRDEFDRAISRINALMFEDSGMTRYIPREEFNRAHDGCRQDIIKRIERLEGKQ